MFVHNVIRRRYNNLELHRVHAKTHFAEKWLWLKSREAIMIDRHKDVLDDRQATAHTSVIYSCITDRYIFPGNKKGFVSVILVD